MKNLFLALAILSAGNMIGCKSNGTTTGGTPEEVLSSFLNALSKKDIVTAKKLATPESEFILNSIAIELNKASDEKMGKYDPTGLNIGVANITGDEAKVPVTYKKDGSVINFPLKKTDGQWKVAFDMGSVMEMGMEKMKESGHNAEDMTKAMDEMKKMNPDSLKDALKKMNTDSMMNEVKKKMENKNQ